jgi:hypothetical protein
MRKVVGWVDVGGGRKGQEEFKIALAFKRGKGFEIASDAFLRDWA